MEEIRGKWKQDQTTGELIPYVEEKKVHAFHIKNDEMPPTVHPVTGEVFTSKKKFRAATKATGYEEIGDQRRQTKPREHLDTEENIRADVEKAWYLARDNMAPITEKEKELCRREEERTNKNP